MSPIYLRNRSEAWSHTCCAQALARGGDEVPSRDHGEREPLDQLDREERGIEDEVKLEEGEVWEREREGEEDGGKAGGRKKGSVHRQRFGRAARSDRAEYRIGPESS